MRSRLLILGCPASAWLTWVTAWMVCFPAYAPAQTLPAAKEIMENHIKATGGRPSYLNHTSIHLKGTWDVPGMGRSGPLDIFKARPDKFLLKADVPGFKSEVGFDGRTAWNSHEALGPEPKILSGKALEVLRLETDFDSDLNYEKKYKSIQTVAMTPFEGRDCYKIKTINADNKERFLFYEVKSGLLAGLTEALEVPGQKLSLTVVESDYKKFGDRLIGTKTVRKSVMQEIITVTSVEFDKVPDSVFEPPPQVKAQLKKSSGNSR
jgi:hypothetical protein